MQVSEFTRRSLRRLGLSEYEARTYLSLLGSGPLSAKDLSERAGVPYSKIYPVLEGLEGKGWLEARRGRPTRYYPRPPVEAVETSRQRFESEFRASEKRVLEELQPIYERGEIRERPDIWIIRGEANILSCINECLGRCRGRLLVAFPLASSELLDSVVPSLTHLKSLGVKIMVMVSQEAPAAFLRKLEKIAEIQVRDRMFGGGAIFDASEVVLLLGGGEAGLPLAIWSDHVGLVRLAGEYFDYLWRDANPAR